MHAALPEGISGGLADLHIHVGGAVAPHILYSIAHQQGFKLPVDGYWGFVDLVTSNPDKVKSLEDYIAIMHRWTEKIQSSPAGIERAVYEIIGKEYRGSHVDLIELRFNPMKRNEGGERDLDHIIHSAIVGMERATLEYGVSTGLIFCLDRSFDSRLNAILVEKAIKYQNRGVVGIDLAGTEANTLELDKDTIKRYAELFQQAREAGLGTTVHTGETPQTDAKGVLAVLEHLKPDRIGHGIRSAYDADALSALREKKTVLEICPTSNLHTRAVEGIDELRKIIRIFLDHEIAITINTDGPYLLGTSMREEFLFLQKHDILTPEECAKAVETSRNATFIKKPN